MPAARFAPRPAHNIFLAAVPPPHVAGQIATAWRVAGTGDPLRSATLHLSLLGLFPADRVDPGLADLVDGAIGGLDLRGFDLALDRIETFGSGDGRRPVVLCGPKRSEGADRLAATLHRALRDPFAARGLPSPALRRITPHVTLAYRPGVIEGRRLPVPIRWRVTELVLIDSLQGQGRHENLRIWPLGPEG